MHRFIILVTLGTVGCLNDTESRSLSPGAMPDQQVTDATRALAARVDQVGAELVAQNPFLGVAPTFAVVGRPGREIGHPDLNGVLVSEGLAAQLSDDELAGVLALELVRMSSEAQGARDYLQPPPLPALPSGATFDPNQMMTEALVDRQIHRTPPGQKSKQVESATQVASRILESSGRSADILKSVESIHAEASRAPAGPGNLTGKTLAPKWTN